MPTAYQLISSRFEDLRHLAAEEGARRAGFLVKDARNMNPVGEPGDVLMAWNMYGVNEVKAQKFAGTVMVFEEGYTRYLHPVKPYAISLDGHNGSGRWFPGGADRWAALGLKEKPYRKSGEHILVCGQRGIGSREMASPQDWHLDVANRLKYISEREIVVRPHPGKDKTKAPDIDAQLDGAWAVVVWSSAIALRALLRGIPVFYEAPHHILAPAMEHGIRGINRPQYLDRQAAFESMAWAQWNIDEIRSGAPFVHLLRR